MRDYTLHGECRKGVNRGSRIYKTWCGMKQRITNPHNRAYHLYGGRGIDIFAEWLIPMNFINWARENGYQDNLQIDRIDNDKGYFPDNCRFVTCAENIQNKRKKFDYGLRRKTWKGTIYYSVYIVRFGKRYYGGNTKDFDKAIRFRDALLLKIEKELMINGS
jgi:hypothetical protein